MGSEMCIRDRHVRARVIIVEIGVRRYVHRPRQRIRREFVGEHARASVREEAAARAHGAIIPKQTPLNRARVRAVDDVRRRRDVYTTTDVLRRIVIDEDARRDDATASKRRAAARLGEISRKVALVDDDPATVRVQTTAEAARRVVSVEQTFVKRHPRRTLGARVHGAASRRRGDDAIRREIDADERHVPRVRVVRHVHLSLIHI